MIGLCVPFWSFLQNNFKTNRRTLTVLLTAQTVSCWKLWDGRLCSIWLCANRNLIDMLAVFSNTAYSLIPIRLDLPGWAVVQGKTALETKVEVRSINGAKEDCKVQRVEERQLFTVVVWTQLFWDESDGDRITESQYFLHNFQIPRELYWSWFCDQRFLNKSAFSRLWQKQRYRSSESSRSLEGNGWQRRGTDM